MYLNLVFVTCLLACLQPIYSASAPFIKKCKGTDSKCIRASAQAAIAKFATGIPELGVASMDPFTMKSIDASSPDLKLKLKDIVATGLSQCIVKKMAFTEDKSKLQVKLLCTVDAKGKYNMDGRLLILPIKGIGNAHVILRNIQISVEANIKEETGPDGQIHWKIGEYRHSYELKDTATVELDNLFDGNEVLGRAASDLIKTSPNDIVDEMGPPIVRAVCDEIIRNINNFFINVPMSNLAE